MPSTWVAVFSLLHEAYVSMRDPLCVFLSLSAAPMSVGGHVSNSSASSPPPSVVHTDTASVSMSASTLPAMSSPIPAASSAAPQHANVTNNNSATVTSVVSDVERNIESQMVVASPRANSGDANQNKTKLTTMRISDPSYASIPDDVFLSSPAPGTCMSSGGLTA